MENDERDDGTVWGFIEEGRFVELPKLPMQRGGFGPPPFEVTLPSGETRQVIYAPDKVRASTVLITAGLTVGRSGCDGGVGH